MSERLGDEAIRRFICDGYLLIDSGLTAAFNAQVDSKLDYSIEHEFVMGNNILPRVPEMYEVLESESVVGALRTLLGDDYLIHPHRFVHSSVPLEATDVELTPEIDAPAMGKGSMAGSGWHQDAQSPLARARHHTIQHLILFYFPHDTDVSLGPTRVEAGSHLYSRPQSPRHPVLPEFVAAGTVMVTHFDIVHAGFTNIGDRTRYVVKFVASRTARPVPVATAPEWKTPDCLSAGDGLEPAWSCLWRWLHGLPHQPLSAKPGELVEVERLNRIYSASPDSIEAWVNELSQKAGRQLHLRQLKKNADGNTIPVDVADPDCRWSERAIVMEDATYALARAGEQAVTRLCELVESDDPWIMINACFALGEIGGLRGLAWLIRALKSEHQQVVRQALDALGMLGVPVNEALDDIERVLTQHIEGWQEPQVMRGWTAQDQVRLNGVLCLTHVGCLEGSDTDRIEGLLIGCLADPNGYVSTVACEGLRRIDTPSALRAGFAHLQKSRWDPSLAGSKSY